MRLNFVPCQAKWDPEQSRALPSYFQLFAAAQGPASTEDQGDEEQPCLPGSGDRGRVAEQVPSVSDLLPWLLKENQVTQNKISPLQQALSKSLIIIADMILD